MAFNLFMVQFSPFLFPPFTSYFDNNILNNIYPHIPRALTYLELGDQLDFGVLLAVRLGHEVHVRFLVHLTLLPA